MPLTAEPPTKTPAYATATAPLPVTQAEPVREVLVPELDGGEVYNAVKANLRLQHIPVILISGYYPKKRRKDGDMVTEHGHLMLTKPVSMEELIFAIRFEIHKSEEDVS